MAKNELGCGWKRPWPNLVCQLTPSAVWRGWGNKNRSECLSLDRVWI